MYFSDSVRHISLFLKTVFPPLYWRSPRCEGFSGPQVVGVRCPGVPKPPQWRPFAAVTLTNRHCTIVITLTDGPSRIILSIVMLYLFKCNVCEKFLRWRGGNPSPRIALSVRSLTTYFTQSQNCTGVYL